MAILIFSSKNQHGWPCLFFLKKLTWMVLIFLQNINMDGHADFPIKFNMDGLVCNPQKINMDGHADFSPNNQHGWPCYFFFQKINMDGHTDFFIKKLTWMAKLIFSSKKLTWMPMLIFPKKINMDGHADFSPENQQRWPC